jgi:hypothetical protein
MNTGSVFGIVIQRLRRTAHGLVGSKHCRHTLHLTIFTPHSAPHVVVHYRGTHHYIHNAQAAVNAAGNTGTYHCIGRESTYKLGSTKRCIHLAYSALAQNNLVPANMPHKVAYTVSLAVGNPVEHSSKLLKLRGHRRQYAYLH